MKIIEATPLDTYILHLVFDDWVMWNIDLTPQSKDSIFCALSKNDLWKTIKIKEDWNVIYRNDNIDMDSMACYITITGKNPFLQQ